VGQKRSTERGCGINKLGILLRIPLIRVYFWGACSYAYLSIGESHYLVFLRPSFLNSPLPNSRSLPSSLPLPSSLFISLCNRFCSNKQKHNTTRMTCLTLLGTFKLTASLTLVTMMPTARDLPLIRPAAQP